MSSTERRSRGPRSARSSTFVTVLLGTAVAVACGSENGTLFADPAGGSTTSGGSGGKNATGGSITGGSPGAGGSAGTASGTGGDGVTGGSGGDTNGSAGEEPTAGSGGGVTTGGIGGMTGGTGGAGGNTAAGGSGGMTAGGGGDTATGGSGGNLVAGAAGMGAASGAAGTGGNTTAGAAGTGAASGQGGGGGTAGKGGKDDCETLQVAASNALAQAQVCSFTADGRQCTGLVDDLCGCPVPVNDMNSAATAKYLVARKAAEECPFVCPAVVCIEPLSATCVRTTAGSGTGSCRASVIGI
jgi:hypothetical protein